MQVDIYSNKVALNNKCFRKVDLKSRAVHISREINVPNPHEALYVNNAASSI